MITRAGAEKMKAEAGAFSVAVKMRNISYKDIEAHLQELPLDKSGKILVLNKEL